MATFANPIPLGFLEGPIAQKLISNGQTVVDISSGGSRWLESVLGKFQNLRALLYASPEAERSVLQAASIKETTAAQMGGIDTRGTNLDGDSATEGIRHIHFLRIEDARMVGRVLKGAARLLKHSRINYVQFPLDTLDLFTGQTVVTLLIDNHYVLYEAVVNGKDLSLQRYKPWDPHRPRKTALVLAVQERMTCMMNPAPTAIHDQFYRAEAQGIALKGIIHVGAHDGSREVDYYANRGLNPCVLIEANPVICKRLEAKCQGDPRFIVANKAILDKSGPIPFYVTSFDESSSILPPATVLDHYSFIHEERVVEVEGITLDALLEQLNLDPKLFNFLTLDIQGAELLALKGAAKTLAHIDFLCTEVNFENLYEGCGQIDEVDDFLAGFGFHRILTTSPHPTWGDAMYSKLPQPGSTFAPALAGLNAIT